MSRELLESIKKEEGFRSKVYVDGMGNRTIGYGTNLEEGISEAEADELLKMRLDSAMKELMGRFDERFLSRLKPKAAEAIIDMAYNMGVPRLMTFEKMWEAIAKDDYEKAAKEILDSKYAQQLPARAKRNAEKMASPWSEK